MHDVSCLIVWLGIGTRWTDGGAHIAYILAPDDSVEHPHLMSLLSSATDRKQSTAIVRAFILRLYPATSHVLILSINSAMGRELVGQSKNIIRISIYLYWVSFPQTDRGTLQIIVRMNRCCLRACNRQLSPLSIHISGMILSTASTSCKRR